MVWQERLEFLWCRVINTLMVLLEWNYETESLGSGFTYWALQAEITLGQQVD